MSELKVEGGYVWTGGKCCLQQIRRLDDEEIKQAEVMKLSKMSNTTNAIVCMDKSFVDITKGIISYMGAFELQHEVKFMHTSIKDNVHDMIPPRSLPTCSLFFS